VSIGACVSLCSCAPSNDDLSSSHAVALSVPLRAAFPLCTQALRDSLEHAMDSCRGALAAEVDSRPEALHDVLRRIIWRDVELADWWANYGRGRTRFCHGPNWLLKLLQDEMACGSPGTQGPHQASATLAWTVKDRLRRLQGLGSTLGVLQRNPLDPYLCFCACVCWLACEVCNSRV
jgi:hypothetical protein